MNKTRSCKHALSFYKQANSMLGFISGIGLLSLCAAGAIAADSSMDGLRLFYTDDERENAPSISSKLNTSDSNLPSVDALNDSMPERVEPEISSSSDNPNSAAALTFNAVIRSGESVVLLLNDLPCEVNAIDLAVPVLDFECRHIAVTRYTFRYDLGDATLMVYASRKLIGRLSTGDAL